MINKINENKATQEIKAYNEARVLINPVILSKIGLTEYWEACASCLDNVDLVRRPYQIEVRYRDIFDNQMEEIFTGFEAPVLSHDWKS